MYEWQQLIQTVVNEMDDAIMRRDDQALTLRGAGGTSALF